MPRKPISDRTAPRILGAAPLGVTKKLAAQIVRGLRDQLSREGRAVTVKAVRFIPSSRTATGSGSFQVVANTVVEVTPDAGAATRVEALDSVVTVGRTGRARKLESLTIPALQRSAS